MRTVNSSDALLPKKNVGDADEQEPKRDRPVADTTIRQGYGIAMSPQPMVYIAASTNSNAPIVRTVPNDMNMCMRKD